MEAYRGPIILYGPKRSFQNQALRINCWNVLDLASDSILSPSYCVLQNGNISRFKKERNRNVHKIASTRNSACSCICQYTSLEVCN